MLRLFPFGETFDARMGGHPLAAGDPLWDVDLQSYAAEVRLKRRMLAEEHAEYYRGGSECLAAQWEVLALVLEDLAAGSPQHFQLSKRGAEWHWRNLLLDEQQAFCLGDASSLPCEPLDWAGRQIQEDLVLLDPRGGHAIIAGQLCFANDWSLATHLGMDFLDIHLPTPQTTMPSVQAGQRLLDSLKPGRTVWRLNWNFKHSPQLDLSTRRQARYVAEMTARAAHLTADMVGRELYLRVERQTLTRLAQTRVVVFGIHTYISRLEDEAADPQRARRMLNVLNSAPQDVKDYKAITLIEPVLRAYLQSRL